MKKILNLNIYLKTVVFSFFVCLLSFLGMIPLIVLNLGEYPYGLMLGGFISYLGYFLIGILDQSKKCSKMTFVIMPIRMIFFILLVIGNAYLYYKLDIKIFNIYTMIGGYFIPLIVLLVLALIERKKK